MAYSRTNQPADRALTIVLVAALHAGVLALVISGLRVSFINKVNPPPISATNTPVTVPEPTRAPRPHPRTAEARPIPRPADPLPLDPRLADPGPILPTQGTGSSGTAAADDGLIRLPLPPLPSPEPTAALGPRPLGNPGLWATDADYPTNELRLGHAGRVGFLLSVDANGRVGSCTVTGSSGFPALDKATCALMIRRGRFQAGPGTWSSAVRWQIPD
jgi:protein TonB